MGHSWAVFKGKASVSALGFVLIIVYWSHYFFSFSSFFFFFFFPSFVTSMDLFVSLSCTLLLLIPNLSIFPAATNFFFCNCCRSKAPTPRIGVSFHYNTLNLCYAAMITRSHYSSIHLSYCYRNCLSFCCY